MEGQESVGSSLSEALDQGREALRRELRAIGDELGDILRGLAGGGLMIGVGGASAVVGISTLGMVALTQPTPRRARTGYTMGALALGLGAGLIGLGAMLLPRAPIRGLEEHVAEGLSRSLPH